MTRASRAPRTLADLKRLACRRPSTCIDTASGAQPARTSTALRAKRTASAGHLSRQFRLAYGESPYGYLMTRRIERAMALLRRGDLSVTEVCFEVGCSSLGTFSTRFTELVGVPPSVYRREAASATAGMPPCVGEAGDETDQESRSAGSGAAPSVTAMEHHHSLKLPPARATRRRPVAFYRDTVASRSATTSRYGGMHWITVGPPGQPGTAMRPRTRWPPPPASPTTSAARSPRSMAKETDAGIEAWPTADLDADLRAAGGRRRARSSRSRPTQPLRSARLRHPRCRRRDLDEPGRLAAELAGF